MSINFEDLSEKLEKVKRLYKDAVASTPLVEHADVYSKLLTEQLLLTRVLEDHRARIQVTGGRVPDPQVLRPKLDSGGHVLYTRLFDTGYPELFELAFRDNAHTFPALFTLLPVGAFKLPDDILKEIHHTLWQEKLTEITTSDLATLFQFPQLTDEQQKMGKSVV